MTLVQITNYTSPNYTHHPQVNILYTVLKNFSPFTIFVQLALALKKHNIVDNRQQLTYDSGDRKSM